MYALDKAAAVQRAIDTIDHEVGSGALDTEMLLARKQYLIEVKEGLLNAAVV